MKRITGDNSVQSNPSVGYSSEELTQEQLALVSIINPGMCVFVFVFDVTALSGPGFPHS